MINNFSNGATANNTEAAESMQDLQLHLANRMTLADAAQFYASQGFRVFPLQPNSKLPPEGRSWSRSATSDPEIIKAWWTTHPQANIGIAMGQGSGVLALDIDNKPNAKGIMQEGSKSYQAIVQAPYPGPLQHTPTGGQHLLFKYTPGYINFTHKGQLGGLDLRTDNGYIVVAPSITADGAYVWGVPDHTTPVPEMPPALRTACEQWSTASNTVSLECPDVPEDVLDYHSLGLPQKYINYLDQGDTSPWGFDESATIFAVSGALMHRLNDREQVYGIMLANPFAWDCASRHRERGNPGDWLWKYGIGKMVDAAATIPASEVFTPLVVTDPNRPWEEVPTGQLTPSHVEERAARPALPALFMDPREGFSHYLGPSDWLISGIMESGQVGVLYGGSGTFKSFVALDMSLRIALGVDWHSQKVYHSGDVIYISGEAQRGLWGRVEAWRQHYNLPQNHKDRVDPITRQHIEDSGLYLTRSSVDVLNLETLKPVNELVHITGNPPRLIVIDTMASNMYGNENSTEDVTRFVNTCKSMCQAWGSAVLIVHHSGHSDSERMRGSSALFAGIDYSMRVERQDNEGKYFIDLVSSKAKDAKLHDPFSFEVQEQTIVGLYGQDGNPQTSMALKQVKSSGKTDRVRDTLALTGKLAPLLNCAQRVIVEKGAMAMNAKPEASATEIFEVYRDEYRKENNGKCPRIGNVKRSLLVLYRKGYLDLLDTDSGNFYVMPVREKR